MNCCAADPGSLQTPCLRRSRSARIPLVPAKAGTPRFTAGFPLARECAESSCHDDLSHGSVRFGQPVLAFTYSSAVELISGSTLSFSGCIAGTLVFHLVPSHSTSEIPP